MKNNFEIGDTVMIGPAYLQDSKRRSFIDEFTYSKGLIVDKQRSDTLVLLDNNTEVWVNSGRLIF